VNVTAEQLYQWHCRPGALQRLQPPWERVSLVEDDGRIETGSRKVMEVKIGPVSQRWVAIIREHEPGQMFADEALESPFVYWRHVHRFIPENDQQSYIEDEIDYELPWGAAGAAVGGWFAAAKLKAMFAFRHRRLAEDLDRHKLSVHFPRRRIVISGASGMIGAQLSAFLSSGGHQVERLVRRVTARGAGEIAWSPTSGTIDGEALSGADTVVHLAGAGIADRQWTPERKRELRDSRIVGTKVLSEALAKLKQPPRTLICASAIGYYGNRGDVALFEQDDPGTGFLASLTRDWEDAARPAAAAGIRVVHARFGIVLSGRGGALAKMLLPFKLGIGGRLGNGRQIMSWVALEDVIGAIHHIMLHDSITGPVNVTAPLPVSNRVFTRALANVLLRPALFPIPQVVIRSLYGELGEETLLSGSRVLPDVLQKTNYRFLYPYIEQALRWELGAGIL